MRHAFLVAVPVAMVAMSCTRTERKEPTETPATAASPATTAPPAPSAEARHAIPRPADAVAELGVLTDRPKEELAKLIAPASLGALVEARHCGPKNACDAVRAMIGDHERVEVTLRSADDWGLPAQSTLDTVAKGLTPSERALVHKRPMVVVVKVSGPVTADHVVARAGFALTAAIAERLKGFVYDETVRRIESWGGFGAHAIIAPLGDPAFREDRIAIQLYQQEDGTARLVSLGMRRFGAPDLEIRGAQVGAARSLGAAMNAVALRITTGATEAPLAMPAKASSPATTPAATPAATVLPGATVPVDLVLPPRVEGDPDNVVVRLVPSGGATTKGYDDLAVALFGAAEQLVEQTDDVALVAASQRAAKAFPSAVAKWRAMGSPRATLLVKLPFAIPADGGIEWMWVDVRSVDDTRIDGTLANSPAFITDLKGGSPVNGKRKDVYDWLFKLPDGGTEGGETISILEHRN